MITLHAKSAKLTTWGNISRERHQGQLTEFEKLVFSRGLAEAGAEMQAQDKQVRAFVKARRNQVFIPEEVLLACGVSVEVKI